MDRSREDTLPRYTIAVRRGDEVHEFTALPREAVQVRPPRLVFAEDGEGRALRDLARMQLAKGRPVTLNDTRVHLAPGEVPDKFRHLVGEEGLLRDGQLALGRSQPLTLVVTMTVGGVILSERVTVYRIPELPGDRTSWGGSVGGAIMMLDLRPVSEQGGEKGDEVEVIFSVVSGFDGETPDQALRGLGFVRAFAFAELTRFECDGLLKPGGLTIGGAGDPDPDSFESLMAAGLVAQALAELELRDRRSRTMPASVSRRDAAVAKTVLELFREGESRDDVAGTEFECCSRTRRTERRPHAVDDLCTSDARHRSPPYAAGPRSC